MSDEVSELMKSCEKSEKLFEQLLSAARFSILKPEEINFDGAMEKLKNLLIEVATHASKVKEMKLLSLGLIPGQKVEQ